MPKTSNYKYWQNRIFKLVWINYAAFYLVKVNISVAMPEIMEKYNISKVEMGTVLTVFFIAYAAGQFLNGQLGDRFGARKFLAIGLAGSAIVNILFGFTAGSITLMAVLWGINGYLLSMGWSPSVKTIANWFTTKERPKRSGLLGTSYLIGNAASLALASYIISVLEWKWAFIIPAIICIAIAINWSIRGRNAPEEVGLPTIENYHNGINEVNAGKDNHLGFKFTLKKVLTSRGIWIIAISKFFLDFLRNGFIFWAPTFLFETQNISASMAGYNMMFIPIAGSIGAIFTPWLAHKYFKKKSARIVPPMIILLIIFCYFFPKITESSQILSIVFLAIIGFLTYGPSVMLTSTLPMEYASRKAAASAAGFIDGWAYIGAAVGSFLTGYLAQNLGWDYVFYMWIAGGFLAAVLIAFLWNYRPVNHEYH